MSGLERIDMLSQTHLNMQSRRQLCFLVDLSKYFVIFHIPEMAPVGCELVIKNFSLYQKFEKGYKEVYGISVSMSLIST